MTKPDVWMPLVIRDYLADTGHLSTAEHGAYLLLLMAAWTRGGSLPDDDAQLARITRASDREWKKLRASLVPFFHVSDGGWRQKRLLKELAAATASAAMAGAKAKRGATVRWGKEAPIDGPDPPPSNATSNAPSIAQALPQAMLGDCLGNAPTPTPPSPSLRSGEGRRAREAAAATQIAPSFAVSEAVQAWGKRKGFRDLEAYREVFVGRNLASGRRYVDWDQAFMNAVREDWYGLRKTDSTRGNGVSKAEKRAVVARAIFGNRSSDDNAIDGSAERVA